MALLENASSYILGIITEDETVKNFPKEFIAEAAKWVKSWFLKPEDPKTNAKLEDPKKSIEVKKDIIEDRLAELKDNAQFQKELAERLNAFATEKTKRKGIVENATIEVQGHVHIGDKGNVSNDNYDEKNIIKGSTIKAGGDFRLGDDVFSGNEHVQIVHNYFGGRNAPNIPPQYVSIKAELETLIKQEKIEETLDRFLAIAEQQQLDIKNELLMLYARFSRVNKADRQRTESNNYTEIERNKINAALTYLVEKLKI